MNHEAEFGTQCLQHAWVRVDPGPVLDQHELLTRVALLVASEGGEELCAE